ncbi:MAG TPA: hypothetical protein VFT74_03340 [Isosphaeraceae bacterium]|nr:hypothetical protein [Isosphaeraceae bacterium]
MNVRTVAVEMLSLGLMIGFAVAVSTHVLPLGVPGEWEWSRLHDPVWTSPAQGLLLGLLGSVVLALYAGFVFWGFRDLSRAETSKGGRALWVSALAVASVLTQIGLQSAAPEGFGLTKWTFSLHSSGSNGYYTLARSDAMSDPARFVRQYPGWIKKQDSLHVGTHPPGLFLIWRGVLGFWQSHPQAAQVVSRLLPEPIQAGFREISEFDPLPSADRAALASVGFLTLLACSLTVIPLYFLARDCLSPALSWAAAALWPVVPSAILFQPTADTAFPLLATSALALAISGKRIGPFVCGLVLALAMQLTLAFLAVGLVVAILHLTRANIPWLRRLERVGWTGLGFLALSGLFWGVSGANPLTIWLANAHNHARFYEQFPRSYLAWNLANPIELAVALGLPAFVWAVVGFRRAGWSVWAPVLVLALLQVSGRNLSEVARLWLPLMPPLLISAAAGWSRFGARVGAVAVSVLLVGAQTLWLQATIQVVYALG